MFDAYGRHYPDYPGQQPWQDPTYYRQNPQVAMQQPQRQTAPQSMSYPTIHADIVQTDDPVVIDRWTLDQGRPQMFVDSTESTFVVKSVTGNGVTLEYYDKRPPAPPAPVFVPSEYVRKDELKELLAATLAAQSGKTITENEEAV